MDPDNGWELYVDNSSNKQGSGAGLILTGPDNFITEYAIRFGFRASNNEAEYEALIIGINLAVQVHAYRLKAFSDSKLVVSQVNGEFEAKGSRMAKYLASVQHLMRKIQSFEIERIPREENAKADALSRLAASEYLALGRICIEHMKKATIETEIEEIMKVEREPCWMDEIIQYILDGKLPEDKKEARRVIQRASRFSYDGQSLYKRPYTCPYLKCLHPIDAKYSLQEVHEGICGEHLGGKALIRKVLLRGLYWPTLRKDTLDLVKKCDKCQKFTPLPINL
ncbi:uncharacterized protein LOC143888479 [Tasmannia lanceolata]|uniref:uncharacterized protein LOC143888479 n=1 Tax=Tasmannia lanceolata TaxID=3420 RepID=UPI004062FBA0